MGNLRFWLLGYSAVLLRKTQLLSVCCTVINLNLLDNSSCHLHEPSVFTLQRRKLWKSSSTELFLTIQLYFLLKKRNIILHISNVYVHIICFIELLFSYLIRCLWWYPFYYNDKSVSTVTPVIIILCKLQLPDYFLLLFSTFLLQRCTWH